MVKFLNTGIAQAKASKQSQGVNQLQFQFLNRLQRIQKAVQSISSMIFAVEATLAPPTSWRDTLDLSSLNTIFNDFVTMAGTGTFDIVGKYDNIDLQLDPVVQRIKNDCNKIWIVSRDSILVTVNLDFDAPNARILKAINPSLNLPVSFSLLQRRLNLQKTDEFPSIWADCNDDPSKFAIYVSDLSNSIKQFKDAVDPVLAALSETDPMVEKFLRDATRGEATMRQASSPEIKDWLAQDSNLLDSFLVRFNDEN